MKNLNKVQKQCESLGFKVVNREQYLVLSSENGNLDAFEYINFDYPVDLIPALHDIAKNAGYEWQCEYLGTYRLYEV